MSAATVTAVAAVAAAGTAAYSASQASKGGGADKYGSKVKATPLEDKIGTSDSYARTISGDMKHFENRGLPQIFDMSQQVNQRAMKQRERLTGGEFKDSIQQEGANIAGLERGQVPQDVVDSINKIVAENLGGAYDPRTGVAGGGFDMSATAADAAKRLGLTSLDMMKTGMSFGPQWRTNVDSFVYKPQDAAAGLYFPAANVALNASKIQAERDYNEYLSKNNLAKAASMPNPQTVGAFNDQLIGNQQTIQAIQSGGSALAGLVNAYNASGSAPATMATARPTTANATVGTPGVYSPSGINLNQPMV